MRVAEVKDAEVKDAEVQDAEVKDAEVQDAEFAVQPELVLHADCAVVGCSMASVTAALLLPHSMLHSTVMLLLCPVQRAALRMQTSDDPPPPAALDEAVRKFEDLWDLHSLPPSPFCSPLHFSRHVAALGCSDVIRQALMTLCGEVATLVWGAQPPLPLPLDPPVFVPVLNLFFNLLDRLTAVLGNSFLVRDAPVRGLALHHRTAHRTAPVHRVLLHCDGVERTVQAHHLFIEQLVLQELGLRPAAEMLDQQTVTVLQGVAAQHVQHYVQHVHQYVQQHVHDYTRLPRHLSPLPPSHHAVVIMGGGAAALGALLTLNAAGVSDVVVVEGGSRVGGRVHTLYPRLRRDAPVELGAQWLHGQRGNLLHDLLIQGRRPPLVSSDYSVDGLGHFFTSEGYELDPTMVEEVWGFFEGREKVLNAMMPPTTPPSGASPPPEGSTAPTTPPSGASPPPGGSTPPTTPPPNVQTVFGFEDHFEREVLADVTDPLKREQYRALYDWCIKWYLADNACDQLSQLATSHWGRYEFCPGECNVNPRLGMTEALMELYSQTRASVRLGTRVLRLSYASSVLPRNGHLFAPDGRPAVTVTCSDGSVLGADAVLVTPSVGVLQADRGIFQPPLPPPISTALYSMGYGTLDKIVLEYREAWWRTYDGQSLQLVWLPTAGAQPDRWEEHVTGFDVTYGTVPRLTGWVSGPGTVAMERCSEAEVAARCTRVFRKFLNRDDIPPPHRVYRSQWGSNPLFRGSYAHPSVQFEAQGCTTAHLNAPLTAALPDHRHQVAVLALAGEANSERHFSTVHGALENGVSQARHFLAGRRLADMSLTASKL